MSMSNFEGTYKLTRCRFVPQSLSYEPVRIERYTTKAAAMRAYHNARAEDGAWPDLFDENIGEYIA